MSFRLEYKNSVKKDLTELSQVDRIAVIRKIEALREEPRPAGSAKLKGSIDFYRIRHGDYRIIYKIQKKVLIIVIIRIGHRRDIYKRR